MSCIALNRNVLYERCGASKSDPLQIMMGLVDELKHEMRRASNHVGSMDHLATSMCCPGDISALAGTILDKNC